VARTAGEEAAVRIRIAEVGAAHIRIEEEGGAVRISIRMDAFV